MAAAVVGYLLGAMSPAALIARARGIDLAEGSGNPGATNVGRLLGLRWGVLVGVLDVLKGFGPALLFFWFFGDAAGEVGGAAAVIGHVSSPFLRGRGGRGVATAFGAVLGVAPLWALGLVVVFAAVSALSRWVGLASMAAGVALVVTGLVTDTDADKRIWAVFLAVVILVRHRTNVIARWRAWRVYG
jgi:glycerol-3-phosphate acyltransferase PlsY